LIAACGGAQPVSNTQVLQSSGNHIPAGASLLSPYFHLVDQIKRSVDGKYLLQGHQAAAALAWLQTPSQNNDSYITLQQGSCWTVKVGSAQIVYVAAAPSCNVLQ